MKKALLLGLILIIGLCSCESEKDSISDDIIYIAETGKYFDEVGNRINFAEDIYSLNLNYAIGWDIETLEPKKIYRGSRVCGLLVKDLTSEYFFTSPVHFDVKYGIIPENVDPNEPIFINYQSIEFSRTLDEPLVVHGYFIAEEEYSGMYLYFYPKFSEDENFYYLHNPNNFDEQNFDFTYNDEIEIQPFGITCRKRDENDEEYEIITVEYFEEKYGVSLDGETKYIEADVYFNSLLFRTYKQDWVDPLWKTRVSGDVRKIEFTQNTEK